MPRVLVITDDKRPGAGGVVLDEHVNSIHLDCEHSAWQFLERLGWAVSDAEHAEHGPLAAAA